MFGSVSKTENKTRFLLQTITLTGKNFNQKFNNILSKKLWIVYFLQPSHYFRTLYSLWYLIEIQQFTQFYIRCLQWTLPYMRICILFERLFVCLFDFVKVYIFSAIRNSFVTVSFKIEFYFTVQSKLFQLLVNRYIAMNFRMDLKIARELVFQHIFGWGNSVCPQWIASGICAVFGWVRVPICVCLWVSMYVFIFCVCVGIRIYCQQTIVIECLCWMLKPKKKRKWSMNQPNMFEK